MSEPTSNAAARLLVSELRDQAAAAAAETAVLRTVIEQLLCVRDLDQLLLSISDRTLNLLDADICGVPLREGDELRMRSCVGHRLVETSRLRMERGQGVAGLVFLTGEPAKVDNYLDDRTISQDFMTLAEQEQSQSAPAVPLRLRGAFLGVLEVWRRRPSRFSEQDVHRMVTLAEVATIAIDNAGLYEQQAQVVAQLRDTRDALENQVTALRRSSQLQQALPATVLDGAGLGALVRTAATELGCPVAIYDSDGRLLARPVPPARRQPGQGRGHGPGAVGPAAGVGRAPDRGAGPGQRAGPVAGRLAAGAVLPPGEPRRARRRPGLGHLARRPGAPRRGPGPAPLRDAPERAAGQPARRPDRGDHRQPRPGGRARGRRRAEPLGPAGRARSAPGLGVSQGHQDPVTLPRAFDEARTALAAAHRFGGDGIFLYEELGIARLLLGSGDAPDLQAFVREVTGPLIDYDTRNDGALLRMLRAFFDADCSQRTAAERLFVHHKTLRYRLGRIQQLTGLDLGHHEDRMRADLALRLLQVNVGLDEENASPQ